MPFADSLDNPFLDRFLGTILADSNDLTGGYISMALLNWDPNSATPYSLQKFSSRSIYNIR